MKKAILFIGLVALVAWGISGHARAADELKLYEKQGHRSPEWNQLIEPGFQAFASRNFPTAYVFLQKAYDRGCRDGLVLYKLGIVHEQKGRYPEAIDMMAQALPRLKKDYPEADAAKTIDAHLGQLYYQADQYDKALPLLLEATKADPDDFTLQFITGQVLRATGKLTQAYDAYIKALALPAPAEVQPDPTRALLKELMAITYEMGRYDESLSYAEKILAADPKDELALSYKNAIKRRQTMEQQDEALKKMMEKYK